MTQINDLLESKPGAPLYRSQPRNTLAIVGLLGTRRCYLNVSAEEALRRYRETEWADYEGPVTVFEFADEFGAYDAWDAAI